jgi:hypothetical protein
MYINRRRVQTCVSHDSTMQDTMIGTQSTHLHPSYGTSQPSQLYVSQVVDATGASPVGGGAPCLAWRLQARHRRGPSKLSSSSSPPVTFVPTIVHGMQACSLVHDLPVSGGICSAPSHWRPACRENERASDKELQRWVRAACPSHTHTGNIHINDIYIYIYVYV